MERMERKHAGAYTQLSALLGHSFPITIQWVSVLFVMATENQ